MDDKLTPQQRANKKQNEARKGVPAFRQVKFDKDQEKLDRINNIIKLSDKSKKQCLIEAFDALAEKYKLQI